MADTCFSGPSLTLLGIIAGVIQAVVVTLFWLAIRAKDDSIRDAREIRDRALDLNEQQINVGERQINVVERAVTPRSRR